MLHYICSCTHPEYVQNVLFTLEKSDRLYRRCADCLRPLALNVEEYLYVHCNHIHISYQQCALIIKHLFVSRYPKWDVACAVHILRNQSYRLLPTTIEVCLVFNLTISSLHCHCCFPAGTSSSFDTKLCRC